MYFETTFTPPTPFYDIMRSVGNSCSLTPSPCPFPCRLFIRSAQQFVHGIIPASNLAADRHNLDDVVGAISREMGFSLPFRRASSMTALEDKLLRVDEVCVYVGGWCVCVCICVVCAHESTFCCSLSVPLLLRPLQVVS